MEFKKDVHVLLTILIAMFASNSFASFITYNGGTTEEANWQTDAGITFLEDFETYSVGTQIPELTSLGVGFDVLDGGGLPVIYNHTHDSGGGTPYGSKHIANFPNGINETNRWDDIVLNVLDGYEVTSLGFWNGDGQSDTLVATIYDDSDNILGTIGAFKGTFAGFISDVAISRVVFDGNTGDGWNHLDGLQTNAVFTSVPEPSSLLLILLGSLGITTLKISRANKTHQD